MKKKIFALLACGPLAFALAGTASAQQGIYVSGNLGISIVGDQTVSGVDEGEGPWSDETSLDTGFAIHGAVGYNFDIARAEFEIGYSTNDYDTLDSQDYGQEDLDGDLTATTFMANAYYDFKNSSAFQPYVGAGIGLAIIDINDLKGSSWDADEPAVNVDDTVFAYQIMVGVAYVINPNISIDLSYRYLGTSDPEMTDQDGDFDYEFSEHNILVGLRYTF